MPNRLADATSPYLLQHAHNPVDWYPWGPEALERARREDLPILLSVGYSACHWCHVMERESFEDPATAALMNQRFVNVKVDREERPDLDSIYMDAVQTFTGGRGGWPMTVFLLPDGRPFYGGTYFPPEPAHGMPSFRQVLDHAHRLFTTQRPQVENVTEGVVGRMRAWEKLPAPAHDLSDRWLDAVLEAAAADHDPELGGFGAAPKFPPHGTLSALLAHHARTGEPESLELVTHTLFAMAQGALYDHLDGGFARYSVDARWAVPHFEKMLYDTAQLVPVYLDAHLHTGDPTLRRVVVDSLDWLAGPMRDPRGGFYASTDADTDGEEGLTFVWTPSQLRELLGREQAERAAPLLGITEAGTFEHGTSVLRMETPLEQLSGDDRAFLEDLVLPTLREARARRPQPGTDTKIVTAWNALAISAFARAGAALGLPGYVQTAAGAADFLLSTLVVDGRLLRTWRDDVPGAPGFADDHAYLLGALIDLYEATFDLRWLREARDLADRMLALFWDEHDGGLYFTGSDAEPLVARSKNLTGGALPSANGMAALGLLRLGTLTGVDLYRARAERIVRSYQVLLGQAARALGPEAIAGDWLARGGVEIGLVGDDLEPLLAVVRARPLPFGVVAALPGDYPDGTPTPDLLPWMAHRSTVDGQPAAYLCRGHACLAPTSDPAALAASIGDLRTEFTQVDTTGRVRTPALPAEPERWVGSEPVPAEDLRGRIVVLDFWALCCINCLHVLPELAAVEEALADEPVAVLGIHSAKFPHERTAAAVADARRRHGVRHPVVTDPDRVLWDAFAVKAWPTLVVLDATGREAWRSSGEIQAKELLRVVRRLLREGRADGTLTADGPLPLPEEDADSEGRLRFPGKVAAWPDAAAQARGERPDEDARLYVADTGNHVILECSLSLDLPHATVLRTFGTPGTPGFDDGDAPTFRDPQGLARHRDLLWIADTGNHAVRRLDLTTGAVETVVGTGRKGRGAAGDPTKPRSLDLRSPWDVAVADDAVFIAMAGTHQIWVYLPDRGHAGPMIGSGAEDHVDGPSAKAALAQPSAVTLFGTHLFWVDSETSSVRLADLQKGEALTVVGRGLFDFGDVDGAGADVRLQHPLGLTVSGGAVWVADTFNHKIKQIDVQGGLTRTVAEGLREPGGVVAWGDHLVIADTGNHRLCLLDKESGALVELPLEG